MRDKNIERHIYYVNSLEQVKGGESEKRNS